MWGEGGVKLDWNSDVHYPQWEGGNLSLDGCGPGGWVERGSKIRFSLADVINGWPLMESLITHYCFYSSQKNDSNNFKFLSFSLKFDGWVYSNFYASFFLKKIISVRTYQETQSLRLRWSLNGKFPSEFAKLFKIAVL